VILTDKTVNGGRKLAIFLPSLLGGGGQRSMLNLAHGIAERGYAIDLVLARAEGVFLPEVQRSVRIVDLGASRALTSLPALVRYLRSERPDAMLSVFGYLNIVALWAWKLSGAKTRMFVNEQNTVSVEAANASSWGLRLTPWLIRRFYPWATGIVVVSKGVCEDMARFSNIPGRRITVIYNPSIVASEVQARAKEPLDHPWFQPGGPPVLLAVGRLQPQKDYAMLLQAFARVREKRPVRLIILGEGKERPRLEAMVEALNLREDVSLPGFVKNPFAYMARSSLFVLSSRWEGLPTVLIEALCCGTPVVSTDCPSGPREILQNGRFGRIVPVGDVGAFAQAIIKSLDEPASKPAPESWQPYELNAVVDHYLDMLLGRLPSEEYQSLPGNGTYE
jgi:glycosyltransferase involved in cell wall biosynthesis